MTDINKMTVAEFRAEGYLQELNRQFLHPLGMAMEVIVEEDGTEYIKAVWDYRDDGDGIVYGSDILDAGKAEKVEWEQKVKHHMRQLRLGFVVQPKGE